VDNENSGNDFRLRRDNSANGKGSRELTIKREKRIMQYQPPGFEKYSGDGAVASGGDERQSSYPNACCCDSVCTCNSVSKTTCACHNVCTCNSQCACVSNICSCVGNTCSCDQVCTCDEVCTCDTIAD
jgi:hypothetical protein